MLAFTESRLLRLVVLMAASFASAEGAGRENEATQGSGFVAVVEAGPHDRQGEFLSVAGLSLAGQAAGGQVAGGQAIGETDRGKAWQAVDVETGRRAAAQWDGEGRLWWRLDEPLAAGKTRRFRLQPADSAEQQTLVEWEEEDGRWVARVSGKPVCVYHAAEAPSPDAEKPYYARSGFLHPLYDPLGRVVTDDFPPDHPHQHGVFYAWVNSQYRGRALDFWNQAKEQGTVRHGELLERTSGPVFGELAVRLAHVSLLDGEESEVLDEVWHLRVYAAEDARVLDLHSQQQCRQGQLELAQYHYGGFGIRGRRNWTLQSGAGFLTSEGHGRLDGNHTRPHWTAMFGPTEGEDWASVLAIGSPHNFRHPQTVRLHPSMPYFCLCPAVEGAFQIGDQAPYSAQFRIIVHAGKPDALQADQWARGYLEPPRVWLMVGKSE